MIKPLILIFYKKCYGKKKKIKEVSSLLELDKLEDKDNVETLLIENLLCVELDIDLKKFINLDILRINNNINITKISSLEGLNKLSHLDISNNSNLIELCSLNGLEYLLELYIFNNCKLTHLPSLDELKHLRKLTCVNNVSLTYLPSLDNLIYLQTLNVLQNNNLTELPKLEKLTDLTKIYCNGIKTLPRSIIHCNSLYEYIPFKDYKKVYNNNFPDLVNYIISEYYYYLPIMEYYNETYLNE